MRDSEDTCSESRFYELTCSHSPSAVGFLTLDKPASQCRQQIGATLTALPVFHMISAHFAMQRCENFSLFNHQTLVT